MTGQLDIFSAPAVLTPKERGIRKAVDHANLVHDGWSDQAYSFLVDFINGIPENRRFMTEQFRKYAYDRGLQRPPSERSFGAIIVRAVKERKIIASGFDKVTNPKAHQANATLWRKL